MRTLSKSDFKLARECVTKLYYAEMGYPRTSDDDPYLEMLAQGGYMVEFLAKAHFADGITMHYDRTDPVGSAAETLEYLRRDRVTLFEATILSGRMLARIDILRKHGNRFELIEVKSKSFEGDSLDDGPMGPFRGKRKPHEILSKWRPYLDDVAYQVHLLGTAFPGAVIEPYLMMPDRSRSTSIEGLPRMFTLRRGTSRGREREIVVGFEGDAEAVRRDKLLVRVDVSNEVNDLLPAIRAEAGRFVALFGEDAVAREQQPISWSCRDCDFRVGEEVVPNGFKECWGDLASPTPHIFDLWKFGSTRLDGHPAGDRMIERRTTSLYDVTPDLLVKKDGSATKDSGRQLVQIEHSRSGTEWVGRDLGPALDALEYPLHFIDFETSQLAVPYHAGMRPYERVAFEWSCHTIARPGDEPRHAEWLNTADSWPNESFARSLRDVLGDRGTVLTWSHYEGNILAEIHEQLTRYQRGDAALIAWIAAARERIVDLHKLCVAGYFHPAMGGRTSIKIVLDALWSSDPEMRRQFERWGGGPAVGGQSPYAALPPVRIGDRSLIVADGTGAMEAYTAMLYGLEREDPASCAAWRDLLTRYCGLDTFAMVLIWDYWRRHTS